MSEFYFSQTLGTQFITQYTFAMILFHKHLTVYNIYVNNIMWKRGAQDEGV